MSKQTNLSLLMLKKHYHSSIENILFFIEAILNDDLFKFLDSLFVQIIKEKDTPKLALYTV